MKKLNKQKLREAEATIIAQQSDSANRTAPPTPPDPDAIAEEVKAAIAADKEKPNPFPLDAFPKAVQAIINHWHSVYRRPVDFHGGSILAAASGAIGNAFAVEHMLGDVEPLSVWMVIVGPPSSAKSPIMKTCLKPLFQQEKEFGKEYEIAKDEWEIKVRSATKNSPLPPKPIRQQRIVSDATVESLIKIFPGNWRGVLSFKDEFIGLLKSMNAYKNSGQDLEHFLSMWSGTQIMLNRSGLDDPVYIDVPFMSILGSIQPGILSGLTDGGKLNNGFPYRLLFCYPENTKIPKPTGVLPSPKVAAQYKGIIDRLTNLPANPQKEPVILQLHPDAFQEYEAYKVNVEQEIINRSDDEQIQSLYGKIISYALRLAGLLELMEFASCNDERAIGLLTLEDMAKLKVSANSVRQAIKLAEYFTRNSLKILTHTEDPTAALPHKQRHLYEKLPNSFTSGFAVIVADKLDISEKTARRLIRDKALFAQNKNGSYRKLYT